jgi:hypothetical protein
MTRIDNITIVPTVEQLGTHVRLNESQINQKVFTYLNELKKTPRTPISATIEEFFELLQTVVMSKQEYDGEPPDKRILVVEEDPPETIDTECITFFLKSRENGQYSQGAPGQGKVKEITPHLRSIVDHPEAPSMKLITMGKFYDNLIQFNIYARTTKEARKRLLWFERTMDIYNWFFRLYSFKIAEVGVGERERITINGIKVTKYPITYWVRTDDTFFFSQQELRDILIKVNISTN